MVTDVRIRIPKKFSFLATTKSRYKVIWGGRGKGASWSIARVLIEKAHSKKLFILCAREIQNSIEESVHRLLSQQIEALGLSEDFEVGARSIICKTTGSEFVFMGLFRNVSKIKSLEGVDYLWIEEAENTSEETLQLVIPTIRKKDSEIWLTFNTDELSEDDPVYVRFILNRPENCITCFATYEDNPYFPDVLRLEMEADKAFRPEVFKVVWQGKLRGKGGRLWAAFDENIHIKDLDLRLMQDKKAFAFMACDPAQHYYPACLWIAMIPTGDKHYPFTKWIYNEYPTVDGLGEHFHALRKKLKYTGTLLDLSQEIFHYDETGRHGIPIRKRFIDTRFALGSGSGNIWSNQTTGLVEDWRKKENGGVNFDCPNVKMIDTQKNEINRDLQYNTLSPVSQYNCPHLLVAPWCRNTIDMFKNHCLESDSEKENEKRKDFSDALRIVYAGINSESVTQPVERVEENVFSYSSKAENWMGA